MDSCICSIIQHPDGTWAISGPCELGMLVAAHLGEILRAHRAGLTRVVGYIAGPRRELDCVAHSARRIEVSWSRWRQR